MISLKNILKNKEKAAYSIETAIVMTVTFTVLIFLIFMTYVMYEQVRLNAIAQDAAERGAIIYAVQNKEMITGRMNSDVFSDQNPYWRIVDVDSSARKDRITEYVWLKLNAYKLDKEQYPKDKIKVEIKNYFIYKRVCVGIDVDYKVPFGGILSFFIKNPYPVHAYAEANVSEPAEFIRTIDLGSDIINGVGGKKVDGYKGAIQKAINWIKK